MRRDVWLMKVKENVLLTGGDGCHCQPLLSCQKSFHSYTLPSPLSLHSEFCSDFQPSWYIFFLLGLFSNLLPIFFFLKAQNLVPFLVKHNRNYCCKCNFNCWVTDQIKRKMIDISVVRKTNCRNFFLLKSGAGEIFLNTSKFHLKIAFYWENRNVASVGFMLYTVIITLLLPLSEYKKLDHKSNCYSSVCIH